MARARNIKPSFFTNDELAEIDPLGRLLFIALWTIADREGRLEDRPKRIKAEALPYDDCDADELLDALQQRGLILRYTVESSRFIQVVNFTKHQNPHHKEVPSEIPPPPGMPAITKHAYDVPDDLRNAIMDRDGRACLKCGATESLSIDHVVPLAKGGDNSPSNLQTLCKRCNSGKGDTTTDHRKSNVTPTLPQDRRKQSAPCPPDSGFLIPDSNNPPNPPAGGEKPKRERNARMSLKTFIERCMEAGEKPISEYRPLQEYVQATGLPMEFVQLCWAEFKGEFLPPGAKAARLQVDWRRHFLNFVRKGYYRLWFAKPDGTFELTTAGLQAKSFHRHREAA